MDISQKIKNIRSGSVVGLKKSFLTGLAALLPTLLTIFIIIKFVELVNTMLGTKIDALFNYVFNLTGDEQVRGLGFLVAILLVLVIGFILATFLGRKIYSFFEVLLRRIPIINTIYSFTKQIIDFFMKKETVAYKRVVMVEYPRKGLYSLGLVTGNGLKDLTDHTNHEMVSIFIPSSPTPVTGYTIVVHKDDVIPMDMDVEEAIRFTVSAGVIVPPKQVTQRPNI